MASTIDLGIVRTLTGLRSVFKRREGRPVFRKILKSILDPSTPDHNNKAGWWCVQIIPPVL
ncbi:MAG: hypothetical protein ACYC9S_05915 [Leptospirales bacterium]